MYKLQKLREGNIYQLTDLVTFASIPGMGGAELFPTGRGEDENLRGQKNA